MRLEGWAKVSHAAGCKLGHLELYFEGIGEILRHFNREF